MFRGNTDEYKALLDSRLAELVALKGENRDVTGWADDVDWDTPTLAETTDRYLAALVTSKIITAKRLETARRVKTEEAQRRALISSLIVGAEGEDPVTPRGFVSGRLRKLKLRVGWKGAIRVGRKSVTLEQLQRLVRLAANEAGFAARDRGVIDDATAQWFEDRLEEARQTLATAFNERKQFDWHGFVRNHFKETPECSYELIIAILKKFVHQVRRKLAGLPVEHHLMIVLHGLQGAGKTYLLGQMLKPFADSVAWSDFDQLTDSRNLDLWSSPIIVLDEMAKATRADIETVKHVITSTSLDRRPMRSNRTIQVANEAVLIGASNHRLDELIRDETGIRRFIELLLIAALDRDIEFDFGAMWSSVQPEDADPLENYRDQLAAAQAPYRNAGPVEDWLESQYSYFEGKKATTQKLYDSFKDHRAKVTMGADFQSRTMQAFSSELRRIIEHRSDLDIRKVRESQGFMWHFGHLTFEVA